MITTRGELIATVLNDYEKKNAVLTSAYFDFNVNMAKDTILSAYKEIQRMLNGDVVTYPETAGNYNGNCKQFLISLNNKPGYERFFDGDTEDESMKLSFAF